MQAQQPQVAALCALLGTRPELALALAEAQRGLATPPQPGTPPSARGGSISAAQAAAEADAYAAESDGGYSDAYSYISALTDAADATNATALAADAANAAYAAASAVAAARSEDGKLRTRALSISSVGSCEGGEGGSGRGGPEPAAGGVVAVSRTSPLGVASLDGALRASDAPGYRWHEGRALNAAEERAEADGVHATAIEALHDELAWTKRRLTEAVAAKRMQEEDVLRLQGQVTDLAADVEAARASAAKANAVGGYSGLRLRLDPEVQRELTAIRHEWEGALRDVAVAQARAAEEVAISAVLRGEVALCEEAQRQARWVTEELRRSAFKANKREQELLREVRGRALRDAASFSSRRPACLRLRNHSQLFASRPPPLALPPQPPCALVELVASVLATGGSARAGRVVAEAARGDARIAVGNGRGGACRAAEGAGDR